MSNYSGESPMDPDYNVDEAESLSTRPEREEHVYESFRDEFKRSAARRDQRRAEIARGKLGLLEDVQHLFPLLGNEVSLL